MCLLEVGRGYKKLKKDNLRQEPREARNVQLGPEVFWGDTR